MKRFYVLITLSFVFGCGCVSHSEKSIPPSEAGVRPGAIWDFVKEINTLMVLPPRENTDPHAFVLLKDGNMIAEGAWTPFSSEQPHMLFSLSKSFTSTAIGFAVQENLLSVDERLVDIFPEDLPETVSENLENMRIYDLLTMQTGHTTDPISALFQRPENMVAAFLAQEVPLPPGTHFLYNNSATFMLSAIISKRSGVSVLEYLRPRLFEPLGINDVRWDANDQGINWGAWGLFLSARDLAKFGQFYLQQGMWNHRQLLDRQWVQQATSKQSSPQTGNPDWVQGYGFQFWICQNNAYRGDGYMGQYVVIMPKANAVLVYLSATENMQKPLDALWSKLYPALCGEAGNDTMDDAQLSNALKRLSAYTPEAFPGTPLYQAGDKIFLRLSEALPLYENGGKKFSIQSIGLSFTADGICVDQDGENMDSKAILFPFGDWQSHKSPEEDGDAEQYFSRAVWTDANKLSLIMLPADNPFRGELELTFEGNAVTVFHRDNKPDRKIYPAKIVERTSALE